MLCEEKLKCFWWEESSLALVRERDLGLHVPLPATLTKKEDWDRETTTAGHGGKLAGVMSSLSVPWGWNNGEMWEQPCRKEERYKLPGTGLYTEPPRGCPLVILLPPLSPFPPPQVFAITNNMIINTLVH